MKSLIKASATLVCLLSLAACASTGNNRLLSPQIAHAPAIDVPLSAVVDNVNENLGVNVRWGGQIIHAEDVQKPVEEGQQPKEITRVTVVAHPLLGSGKPDWRSRPDFDGGRFIVEISDFHEQIHRRFITVYGPISGAQTLSNGKRQTTIPVVTALESADWNDPHDRYRYQVGFRHDLPYNGLGFRYGYYDGYGYSGSVFYGVGLGLYPFYSPYPYFSYGHRIGRRGHHH